ncbi:MAG: PilN domain-containing protein [Dolichospermum sp.]
MYNLDINLLRNRTEFQQKIAQTNQLSLQLVALTPVYVGIAVGLLFPALMFLSLSLLQWRIAEVAKETLRLEGRNRDLDQIIVNIQKIKAEIATINTQTKSLVKVFDQIHPWSAMLSDLRDRIPPRVQIESIKQTSSNLQPTANNTSNNTVGYLEISGFAVSYTAVNDFTLSLGQSKFFDPQNIKIMTTELVDAPAITGLLPPVTAKSDVKFKPIQIVKYTVKTGLSRVPASDLIPELEKKGTIGLVDRLRHIQKLGVVNK